MGRCTTVTQRCYTTIECGRKYSLWLLSKSHTLSSINCICSFKVLHATCIQAYIVWLCLELWHSCAYILHLYETGKKETKKKNGAGTFTWDKLTFCRNWYSVGCFRSNKGDDCVSKAKVQPHRATKKKLQYSFLGKCISSKCLGC